MSANRKRMRIKYVLLFLLVCCIATSGYFSAAGASDTYNCNAGYHKDTEIGRVPATETQDGYILYQCEICQREYEYKLFAGDHDWNEWTVEKEASCYQSGRKRRVCTSHETHYQTEIIPAAHKYVETVKQPGCSEAGERQLQCSVCDTMKTETFGEPLGHEYKGTVTLKARCNVEGMKTYTCIRCDDSYTEPLPALEHKYGEWIIDQEPSEGTAGSRHKACENGCGEDIVESIEALAVVTTANIPVVPEENSEVKIIDIVVTGINVGLITFFISVMYVDVHVLSWLKKRRELIDMKDAAKIMEDLYDDFI